MQGHSSLSENTKHAGIGLRLYLLNACVCVCFYLQYAVSVPGNRAVDIQHIILGVDPPYLKDRGARLEKVELILLSWTIHFETSTLYVWLSAYL